jgi:hypothetical protein
MRESPAISRLDRLTVAEELTAGAVVGDDPGHRAHRPTAFGTFVPAAGTWLRATMVETTERWEWP